MPISEANVPTPPFQINTVHVENLALKEVPDRLAAYLIHLADKQEKKDLVTLSISKEQLARLLGTTPETLSQILKQTADKGLIEIKRRDINILNYKEVAKLAEHGRNII